MSRLNNPHRPSSLPDIDLPPDAPIIFLEDVRPIHHIPEQLLNRAPQTEAEMEAYSIRCRLEQTSPPSFPILPPGAFALDEGVDLHQLRAIDFDDPHVTFSEGDPRDDMSNWWRKQVIVEKYMRWLDEGHTPPPLTAVETLHGNVRIVNGHHRVAALTRAGIRQHVAWVALTWFYPLGNGTLHGRGLMLGDFEDRRGVGTEQLMEWLSITTEATK